MEEWVDSLISFIKSDVCSGDRTSRPGRVNARTVFTKFKTKHPVASPLTLPRRCFPFILLLLALSQIPSSDPRTGLQSCMPFFRSAPSCGRGPLGRGHREQLNAITSYVDASMVYGSSPGVASALRDRLSPRGALALNPQHSDHGLAYMPFLSRGPQARLDPCGPRRGGNLSSSGPQDGSPRRDNATSCFQAGRTQKTHVIQIKSQNNCSLVRFIFQPVPLTQALGK